MKKIIPIIIVLVVLGGGFFLYQTRPVESPAVDVASQTVPVEQAPEKPDSTSSAKTYAISQSNSKASFTISEELNGSPKSPVGTTSAIAGEMRVDTDAKGARTLTIGTLKIDATTFKTDSEKRDGAIVRLILKSDTPANNYIVFTPTDTAIPFTDSTAMQVKGNLTVSGVTKPVTFTVKASIKDGVLSGSAAGTLKRSDFNLTIPSIPFVANVSDSFTISAAISAPEKK